MLGTRITSFAFGFACASGISMYKLKEEIWSSHKILAGQVGSSSSSHSSCLRTTQKLFPFAKQNKNFPLISP